MMCAKLDAMSMSLTGDVYMEKSEEREHCLPVRSFTININWGLKTISPLDFTHAVHKLYNLQLLAPSQTLGVRPQHPPCQWPAIDRLNPTIKVRWAPTLQGQKMVTVPPLPVSSQSEAFLLPWFMKSVGWRKVKFWKKALMAKHNKVFSLVFS